MTRWIHAALLGLGVMVMAPAAANAATIFIDFDTYAEGDTPGEQGVTFTNAIVLTSGAIGGSLNEIDFPPVSDFNVAGDNGGEMTLDFSTPVVSFSGFFTYNTPLVLTAFNGVNPVDTTPSGLVPNLGANELLSLASAGGITRIVILGDVLGGSFAVDNVTAETRVRVAPEPASMWLLGLGAAALVRRRVKHQFVA